MNAPAGITLDSAVAIARQALADVNTRSMRRGYYTGDRTALINSHAQLCVALEMLIKAAEDTADTAQQAVTRPNR